MYKIILLNKKIGQTPLQAIVESRIPGLAEAKPRAGMNHELREVKLGYAGRLDPMAEGLLLVMAGEECKKREKYQKLDKEYEADILFGISTDSYDVLGIPTDWVRIRTDIKRNLIEEVISQFKGRISQKLPPYSAYRIGKNAMYKLAREKKLDYGKLPEKDIEIKDIKIMGYYEIKAEELEKLVLERIQLVKGNFRQEEIIEGWKRYFQRDRHGPIIIGPRDDPTSPDQIRLRVVNKYQIIKLKISCSSGTYIRSLANDIGIRLGIPAMLLNLKRTKIGRYRLPVSGYKISEIGY